MANRRFKPWRLALLSASTQMFAIGGMAHACDYPDSILEGFTPSRRTIPADGHEDVRIRIAEVLVSTSAPLQWFGIRGEILASDDPAVVNRRIEVRGFWNAQCFVPGQGFDVSKDQTVSGWLVGQFTSDRSDSKAVLNFVGETRVVKERGQVLHWQRLRWAEPE